MRKFYILLACLLTCCNVSFAQENESLPINTTVVAANIPVAPQGSQISRTAINQCYDTISMNSEQLFYLTLAALNKMNFKIKEVQSKTGTVLFQAYSREFLVTIADKGTSSTFIKILPTDSNYAFSPALVQNIFTFLKANSAITPVVL